MIESKEVTITAYLEARLSRCDYGVEGSPTWMEAVDVNIDSVYMFGREWSLPEIKEKFGDLYKYIEMEWIDE